VKEKNKSDFFFPGKRPLRRFDAIQKAWVTPGNLIVRAVQDLILAVIFWRKNSCNW